jgi:hypothetical protein
MGSWLSDAGGLELDEQKGVENEISSSNRPLPCRIGRQVVQFLFLHQRSPIVRLSLES